MSGEIVTTEGRVVGTHPGIERFTIGQRKGLGVAMGEPYFVVRIEPATRQVVIGKQAELACRELTAADCNWLADPPADQFACQAKIRYNSPPAEATAELLPDGRLHVCFADPRHGVAPGQAVVLYEMIGCWGADGSSESSKFKRSKFKVEKGGRKSHQP